MNNVVGNKNIEEPINGYDFKYREIRRDRGVAKIIDHKCNAPTF